MTIYDYASTLGDVPADAIQRGIARHREAHARKVEALRAEEEAAEARYKELMQLHKDATARLDECAARRPNPGTPERAAWHEELIARAAEVQLYHAAMHGTRRPGGRTPDLDRVDAAPVATALLQLSISRVQLAKELGVTPASVTHALQHPLGLTKSMYARMTEALEQIALRRAMS